MQSLHQVLDEIYQQMLPLCSQLTATARAIAGFAALFYIANRVYKHLAAAEPIDFYPLLRPFALGLAITLFPQVLGCMNGMLKPITLATEHMVQGSNQAIEVLLQQKQQALEKTPAYQMYLGMNGEGDRSRWYEYTYGENAGEGWLESVGHDLEFTMAKAAYQFRNSIKEFMSQVLELLFEAAALCINTIRTFNLIVLSILGPIVFGLAVFDGFTHSLKAWMARYVHVYLWLPVANIFGSIIGKIQENMLLLDLDQIAQQGDTYFSSTDSAYLIFLIMGTLGYFAVPSVTGYIVQASGGSTLVEKVNGVLIGALSASSQPSKS